MLRKLLSMQMNELEEHWKLRRTMYQHPDREYLNTMDYPYYVKGTADECLLKFDSIMKKLNKEYILLCGTALGLKRDITYIKDDDDIDIGIIWNSRQDISLISKELRNNGFTLVWKYLHPIEREARPDYFYIQKIYDSSLARLHFLYKNVLLDLMVCYEVPNDRMLLGSKETVKKDNIVNTNELTYLNTKFRIPLDGYFEEVYGKWQEPISAYDWRKGRI